MHLKKMKLKQVIIFFLGLTFWLTGCKKDQPTFVTGEVLFSVYDSIPFQDTYGLIDSLNLKILAANDFGYYIKTTADSVDTLKLILGTKSYLNIDGVTLGILYIDSIAQIDLNFFDLDDNDALDWFSTVTQLKLKENLTDDFNKWGVLKVPDGQEQYWVDKLKQYSIIKAVQLNHILYD
jgi:hypothetical protein